MVTQGKVLMTSGCVSPSKGRVFSKSNQRRAVHGPAVLTDNIEWILKCQRIPQGARIRTPSQVRNCKPLRVLPSFDVVLNHESVVAPLDGDHYALFETHFNWRGEEPLRRIPYIARIHDQHSVT